MWTFDGWDPPFPEIGASESVNSKSGDQTMFTNPLKAVPMAAALAASLIGTGAAACSTSNCAVDPPAVTLAQQRPGGGNTNGGFDGLRPEPKEHMQIA